MWEGLGEGSWIDRRIKRGLWGSLLCDSGLAAMIGMSSVFEASARSSKEL